jgi:hypothetical protein
MPAPSPKPETKVAVEVQKAEYEQLDERIMRLEERLNSLHNYILGKRFSDPLLPLLM